MDILFIAGGVLLWGTLALLVLGLQRLDKQDGKGPAARPPEGARTAARGTEVAP